jgi:hypothetical protein
VRAELSHEDQQIDVTKRAVAFRHFWKDDKIINVFHTLYMFRMILTTKSHYSLCSIHLLVFLSEAACVVYITNDYSYIIHINLVFKVLAVITAVSG